MIKKHYIWDSELDMKQGIDIENRTIELERNRAIRIINKWNFENCFKQPKLKTFICMSDKIKELKNALRKNKR